MTARMQSIWSRISETHFLTRIANNLGLYSILLFCYLQLKGMSPADSVEECYRMKAAVQLTDKGSAQSQTLSGGMKRKLSVAIAFSAGSKVKQTPNKFFPLYPPGGINFYIHFSELDCRPICHIGEICKQIFKFTNSIQNFVMKATIKIYNVSNRWAI